MWRYALLNLSFVLLVITLVSIQHSDSVFGPTAHGWRVTGRDHFAFDGESWRRLRVPSEFSRAAAFLNDTWRRGKIFNEWLMEYNASQWEIFRASSPAETDLLDAKFHIANAEVFTEAMSETDRAIKELERAVRNDQNRFGPFDPGRALILNVIGSNRCDCACCRPVARTST